MGSIPVSLHPESPSPVLQNRSDEPASEPQVHTPSTPKNSTIFTLGQLLCMPSFCFPPSEQGKARCIPAGELGTGPADSFPLLTRQSNCGFLAGFLSTPDSVFIYGIFNLLQPFHGICVILLPLFLHGFTEVWLTGKFLCCFNQLLLYQEIALQFLQSRILHLDNDTALFFTDAHSRSLAVFLANSERSLYVLD